MHEFLPNNPNRIAKRVTEKLGFIDSREAKPLGKLKVPVAYTTLRHYLLEPEEEGQPFLCGEKMQQLPRGRWIQLVAMTRN
eukprot:5937758-Pyramimonas_sp.AAC.1